MYLAGSISIWSILLFIIAIGLLITIHELGHFTMAKIFNVYVNEFSIGFGPQLFKVKKGETTYSVRAIPLGGYVAMFGEGMEVEDNSIPQERSLLGIKKWKRAIILFAGIFLNFILGYVLFFASNAFFPEQVLTNQVVVVENSLLASQGTIETGDYIVRVDKKCTLNGDVAACSSIKKGDISMDNPQDLWNSEIGLSYSAEYAPKTKDDVITFTITYVKDGSSELKQTDVQLRPVLDEDGQLVLTEGIASWGKMGVSAFYMDYYHQGLGEIFKETNKDFGESTVIIAKTLGGLFVGKNWDQIGGPVAILTTSSTILENFNFGMYIFLWASISVNLAIFNLLPFPGLDGWHLLVVAIEGITKKEVPEKVKNIVSAIGMILLFALMIFVTGRDIIGIFK